MGQRRFPVGVVWLGWWMVFVLVGGVLPAQGQVVSAPQFAPSSYPNGILNVQLDENQSGEQARGVLLSSVVARGVSPITYSIVENVMGAGGANLYAVDPPTRGNIYYRGPALDFEAPGTVRHSITVRASNLIGHDDLTVNITVRNVNEPPAVEVMLPDLNLKDGGTERVDLRRYFVDPDENDELTFTALSDRPSVVSTLISGNQLSLNAVDQGLAYVEVRATDRAGVSAPGIHSFQVLVVANSRPVIDRAGVAWDNLLGTFRYTLNENVDGSDNAVIVSQGLFMANDADVGDRIRWSLEGPDEELEGFQINSTGRLTYRGEGLDFENKRTHTFYVVASDGAATDRVQVIVQVLNRLEPPQLATELEDVTLPITTSALAIDLAENFAESDAGETFIYSVASDRAEVEAWILGVAGSSRIVLVPRFEGEAIIEVCVTDEDITVPDPSLVQADRITYNTQLHTACRASSSRIVETFDVDVVRPDVNQPPSSTPTTSPTTVTTPTTTNPVENQSPFSVNVIPSQSVVVGGTTVQISLLDIDSTTEGNQPAFRDADDGSSSLTYEVTSYNPLIASVRLSGSTLRIWGRSYGNTYITVQATDPAGLRAASPQVFAVSAVGNSQIEIRTGPTREDYPQFPLALGWRPYFQDSPWIGEFRFGLSENVGKRNDTDPDIPIGASGRELHEDCYDTEGNPTFGKPNCSVAYFIAEDNDWPNDTVTWSLLAREGYEGDVKDFYIKGVKTDIDDDPSTPDEVVGQLFYTGKGLDFERKRVYYMKVRVRDAIGSTDTQHLTIAVSNVVEMHPMEDSQNRIPDLRISIGTPSQVIDVAGHFVQDITRSWAPVYFAVQPDSSPNNAVVRRSMFGQRPSSQILLQPRRQGMETVQVCATTVLPLDPNQEDPPITTNPEIDLFLFNDCVSGLDPDGDPETDDAVATVVEFDVVVGSSTTPAPPPPRAITIQSWKQFRSTSRISFNGGRNL